MHIVSLEECEEFISGDNARLRELLHPDKASLEIRYSLAHAIIEPGGGTTPHILATSEVYYIIAGEGLMHIDDKASPAREGHAVYIPPNATQWITNTGRENLEFICIVDPAWRVEDEKILE